MKKWMWLFLAAGILLSRVEHTGTAIDLLEPAQVVRITVEDEETSIETDTGAKGIGKDLTAAVENLHSSSPTVVFLETAEYLIVNERAVEELPEVYELLRPSCQMCVSDGELDLKEAGSFLKTHSSGVTLLQYRAEPVQLPKLYCQEGRGQLVQ